MVNEEVRLKAEVRSLLKHADSFSVTTDTWTCKEPYITFTLHWIDTRSTPWALRHACLNVRPLYGHHTGEALGAAADTAVDSAADGDVVLHRMKVWAAVADGAAAQQNAFDNLGEGWHSWSLWCECHIMHLVVTHSIAAVPQVPATYRFIHNVRPVLLWGRVVQLHQM